VPETLVGPLGKYPRTRTCSNMYIILQTFKETTAVKYVRMCVCIYMYLCMYVGIYLCMCVCMHVCMFLYIYIYVCIYVCM